MMQAPPAAAVPMFVPAARALSIWKKERALANLYNAAPIAMMATLVIMEWILRGNVSTGWVHPTPANVGRASNTSGPLGPGPVCPYRAVPAHLAKPRATTMRCALTGRARTPAAVARATNTRSPPVLVLVSVLIALISWLRAPILVQPKELSKAIVLLVTAATILLPPINVRAKMVSTTMLLLVQALVSLSLVLLGIH